MQGTIGVISFRDGSYVVTFYSGQIGTGTVPDYKMPDLDGLKQFLDSLNVVLTEEQISLLTSAKSLAIHNVNAPDNILKNCGLV